MDTLHRIARAFDKFGVLCRHLFGQGWQNEILLALGKQIRAGKVKGMEGKMLRLLSG